jgi:hypothetical protein
LAYVHFYHRINLYRLDGIKAVKLLETDENFDELQQRALSFMSHLWGVSSGNDASLDHIEVTIHANPDEEHIPARLFREKRCGMVEALGEDLYRFTADVYDAVEMIPWLRTFIGRIVSIECTNKYVKDTFLADLRAMENMYQGDESYAVS